MARRSRRDENLPRIIDAALELGQEHGFAAVPIAKLAKKAAISPGTVYLYFDNKDDLLRWLFQAVRDRGEPHILKGHDRAKPLTEQFECLFGNVIGFYLDHPREFSFIDQFVAYPHSESTFSVFSPAVEKVFKHFYDDGRAGGILADLPLGAVTSLIHGPIVAMVKKHHSGVAPLTAEVITLLREATWRAISR